jgi:uncharacterized protein
MTQSSPTHIPPLRPCPICGKPVVPQYRPFCSVRCARIDLGRWLKGNYSIPTDEGPDDGDEER